MGDKIILHWYVVTKVDILQLELLYIAILTLGLINLGLRESCGCLRN